MEESKKLYDDLKRHGIQRLTEWDDLPDDPFFLLTPENWDWRNLF
jgi:hypothetical protein